MPRRRLAAALLLPPPLAAEVDGLRRAFGDPALPRVAPHVTLVPPTNVAEADVPVALALLRSAAIAAAGNGPVRLVLGPVLAFAPVSPVAYLAVDGDLGAIHALQQHLTGAPFDRPRTFPFVPHVTVATDLPTERLAAIVEAGASFRASVDVALLHLLEEERGDDGVRRWSPIADAALGGTRVVGHGSIPVELSVGTALDPEARAALAVVGGGGGDPFAITARRDGAVVGAAVGATQLDVATLGLLVVVPSARGWGIGRRLLDAVVAEARRRQASWVVLGSPAADDSDVAGFARAHRFSAFEGAPGGLTLPV